MKLKVFFSLMLLILSTFLYVSDTTAENEPHTQWNLPDGAKARLGKGGINDITCSSDGALLAVASQIGIWIYNIQTSEALSLLTGHTGTVERVSFSPDGRTLASGGQDKLLCIWDVATQTEIGTLEGSTGGPNSIWFSPDGKTLASRDDDNTVRLWDVETQTQIHTLEGYTGSVESVSFSPDGRTLASGGQDNSVRIWDVATRTEIGRLQGHTYAVNSIVFSLDGKTLASGSDDGTVRIWDVATRTEIGRLQGHTYAVNSVVFSPDGKTLASGSVGGTVRIWDVTTRAEIGRASGSDDHRVRLWVETRAEIGRLERSTPFLRISFSPDGKTIARLYPSWWDYNVVHYSVDFWDVETQTRANINRYNFIEVGGFDYTMWEVLWVVAAQTEKIGTIIWEHTGSVESVSFSPDGKTIAASVRGPFSRHQSSYFTRMWDVATLTEINTFNLGQRIRVRKVYRSVRMEKQS